MKLEIPALPNLRKFSPHRYIYWCPGSEDPANLKPLPKGAAKDAIPKTRDGKMWASIHLLMGYPGEEITTFIAMAQQIQKIVPHATLAEIKAGRITQSSYVRGFSIVHWSGRINRRSYPGWYNKLNNQSEYCF